MTGSSNSTWLKPPPEKGEGLSIIDKLGGRNLRLKPSVRLYPQLDCNDSYVVADESGNQFFYCDTDTYLFMHALDGQFSLHQVIDKLNIDSVNLEQLELTLTKLIKYGLLAGFDSTLDKPKWWLSFKQPIAMKFALFNPDTLLSSLLPFAGFILSRYFIFLFAALLLFSLYQLPLQWEGIQSHWQSRFFDPINGVLLALAYVFLKSLHEMGHGLAVKKYGGTVNECGVFMLVFLPLPYVDTSSSYAFPHRKQRIIVGAAGMWVELTIAMIAFIFWQNSLPGYWADFLFNLVFVGSFSTLVFNLNPLMRFDGYYILSDYFGVFNLNARSRKALGSVIQRSLFKLDTSVDQAVGSIKYGLITYALCAAPYRLFIGLVIAFYLSSKFFIFGVLLACWVLFQILVFPFIKHIINVYQGAKAAHQRKRFFVVTTFLACATFLSLFLIEFRFSDSQIAMVIEPEEQKVHAMEDGVVVSLPVKSGVLVKKGDLLAQLENPELELQLEIAKGLLDEYKSQYRLVGLSNISMAQSWREKIAIQQKEVALIQQRLSGLKLVAPVDGEFVLSRERDLLGKYVTRGKVLARVYAPDQIKVLVVVSEEQVRQLSQGIDSIEVKFNAAPSIIYKGSILRVKPAAQSELPSRFMGSSVGGMIAVDGRDDDGLQSISPFFLVEVSVAHGMSNLMPAMAKVRFIYKQMSVSDYFLADFWHEYTQKLH